MYAAGNSSIGKIETVELKQDVDFALKVFDELSYGSVYNVDGWRKINIKELSRDSKMYVTFKDQIAGLAVVGLFSCTIYLNPDIVYTQEKLKTTIIHEYLHCLGYSHVDNPFDLMYKSSWRATFESIYGYALDVNQRVNEWKTLKN